MIEVYKKFKNAGLACLPTGPDKMPAIPKGSTWKGGWNNLSEYESSHGIALICGKTSGNLECIDFDNSFGDIKEIFADFLEIEDIKVITDKYDFPIQRTVRGGFHLFYRCDLVEGNQKLAERLNIEGKKGVLIETRGEGGYFCADPTPGYKIMFGDTSKPPVITAEDRIILLSACRSFNEVCNSHKKPEFEDTDKPGDIYNRSSESTGDMRRSLQDTGWIEITEGIWRRPGKDKGISATLGKAHPGIFYNFSSNGHPFENDHGYTAFQVVGLLKYNGDFKRFAKELYEKQNPLKEKKTTEPKPDTQVTIIEHMEQSRIDPLSEMIEPPVYCSIDGAPTMTAGNFIMIDGKKKAGKTWLTGALTAAMISNSTQLNIIKGSLPSGKRTVLYFDTEQSKFHSTRSIKRICALAGDPNPINLIAYGLRPYTPQERLLFIEEKIIQYKDTLGVVIIDGIRDLLTLGINDEAEATTLTSKFLKWTEEYSMHMILLLHQNKTDLNPRGHVGSEMENKAETTISVSKDKSGIYIVSCEASKDLSFNDFGFTIEDGKIVSIDIPKEGQKKGMNPQRINDNEHIQKLDLIFKTNNKISSKDLLAAIVYHFEVGQIKSRDFIFHYQLKHWIEKEREGKYVYYVYQRATF
jgi:hypothetical protein